MLADHADALRAAVVAPGQRALVQVHCHQHAELGTEADHAVMAALGIEAEVLDSGCCGLAGNFGFEQGHYAVSMACAERVLLPAVRAADPDVAVLADGFSCRTQLRQAGTREPVHLAQLAARALGVRQAQTVSGRVVPSVTTARARGRSGSPAAGSAARHRAAAVRRRGAAAGTGADGRRALQEPQQLHRERQHQGGVLLGGDLDDGLQQAQLQGRRVSRP